MLTPEREKEIRSGEFEGDTAEFLAEIDRLRDESEWRNEAAKNYAHALGEARSDLERRTVERNELREKISTLETEIKYAHYHSSARLPYLKEGSLTAAYHQGEIRAYELVMTLLSKTRGENADT